jgi:hypothetical protein
MPDRAAPLGNRAGATLPPISLFPVWFFRTGLTGFTRLNSLLQGVNPENLVNPVKLMGDELAPHRVWGTLAADVSIASHLVF